ncbi:pentatricopeptide repeat-containing protein At2g33680 [Magnolia sinica]|uniref:pentatricopeptide repeat-containing protein At2g33680 n=1 Tax=Magnolia sinica TaxID=86752 RepID=UPI00265860B0|nr:pentatricopeptide repeat-containing protein At2g33680 [Magnolia sinica]XP_058109142.1 pentatricopeptide repeat-containing protein At2g33680 [Magnolia sinica]
MTSSLSRLCFNLLLQYTEKKNLPKGKSVHAHIIKTGFQSNTFLANSVLNMYARCGRLDEAALQFQVMECHDVVSWNCLINANSHNPSIQSSSLVLELFRTMWAECVPPNPFTFAGVFTASARFPEALNGMQAHAVAVKTDNYRDVFVGSSLLNMYCKLGLVSDARQVFDRMPERNSVSWAAMISGYSMERRGVDAFELFKLMREEEGTGVNEFVFTSTLSAFTAPEFFESGKQIHGLAVKTGLLCFVAVVNSIVTMYAKCGCLDGALRMFECSSDKNAITWSAIITGYAQNDDSTEALRLFLEMHSAGIRPSEFTFVGILNACSNLTALNEGKQVHAYLLKFGYGFQIFIRSSLVDMYAKCRSIDDAHKEFDQLQEPDVVLWSSMISGYVQNGENEKALSLYCRMEMEGILPNDLTMASVLRACSNLAALEQGKQIHARTIKYGLGLEVPIGSALSTMYAKCGNLEDGSFVFRRMPDRDIVSWNSMISGLSQNGHGSEALKIFDEMRLEGTKPDHVTFVNLLSACSHMGLVDRGWSYFNSMCNEYGIVPRLDHYACMVDILSRAGMLDKAKEFIESVPIDHGMCLWRILLSACRNYCKFDIGAYAGERLMELGSEESSAYVLLSNIYTALGRWEDVERVMKTMRLRGVSKEPGCSWIELKSRVHVFVVGDQLHPQFTEIYTEVRRLTRHMRDEGYRPSSVTYHRNSFSRLG